ncbi:hypothetical protein [Pectobacterium wasabiae]|uniref:Tetratricopeptide repeat protein n=1 Tax=Pectobacterium wasabiae TaxID=55208 RepID=A0AAW3ECH9_9GAMM|nr:hypothetical protein [Pectobacterium wasabiae]AOR62952.1 hypothetical protein A7983_06725 [Pectobacterium wasabiae CFBP 3304]EJS93644.1 Hypothetical protein Y17_3102 [Pectobacterium wasabiae CFBP 3304]KFX02432.1 hypothetical protein JV38_22145 [Pectobacterium wasabiae]KGA26358.1 hypothetical protein KU73_21640 [Pectobacterium wasabiae]
MKILSDVNQELEALIVSVVEKGNHLHDEKSYERALEEYNEAWRLLPEPKLEWEISSWVSACIYSVNFDIGNFYEAKKWAEIALQTRGSDIDTAPLIDLGMICYELKEYDMAYKYFHDAYGYGKKRAFQERPKKYLDFYFNEKSKN